MSRTVAYIQDRVVVGVKDNESLVQNGSVDMKNKVQFGIDTGQGNSCRKQYTLSPRFLTK